MQPRVNSFGGDLIDERQVIVKLLACVCCHGCPPHIPMHLQHPLLSEHVWAQIQLKCRRWILHNVVWWWQHQLDQVRRIDNMDIVAQYWHSVHLSQPATMQRYSSNLSEFSSPNTSSYLSLWIISGWAHTITSRYAHDFSNESWSPQDQLHKLTSQGGVVHTSPHVSLGGKLSKVQLCVKEL